MAQPRSRFPAYPPNIPDELALFLESIRKELTKVGVAGGASIQVMEGGTVVSSAANVLDFLGADFDLTHSPAGEVNITISSGISRVGHTHIKSDLPAAVAYEDEANTFSLAQTITGGGLYLNAEGQALVWDATGFRRVGLVKESGFNPEVRYLSSASLAFRRVTTGTLEAPTASNVPLTLTSAGAVVVGTDPGGSEALRVGGAARMGALTIDTSTSPPSTYRRAGSLGGGSFNSDGVVLNSDMILGPWNDGVRTGGIVFATAVGQTLTNRMALITTALHPITAGLLTLGTTVLPWGDIWMVEDVWLRGKTLGGASNMGLVRSRGFGYNANLYDAMQVGEENKGLALFVDPGLIVGGQFSGNLNELLLPRSVNVLQVNVAGTDWRPVPVMRFDDGDVTLGSLGRFDGADVPSDQQILVYHAGTVNKWQAETLQFVRGAGDFHAALLGDNTAIAYVLLDPGTGADSPVGAPPAPAIPTVTVGHKSFALDIAGYVKPADFRYFEWEHCTGASCTGWAALAFTTSHTLVHSRLTTGNVKRYRVRAVDRAGNLSAFATTGDNTVVAQSDTQAFAGIIAGEIATVDLTALAGDIGILLTGQVRNTANTAGVNFGGVGGIPAGWTAGINFENTSLGSMTRYLNFDSGASGTFLKHERLQVDFDGSVKMYQTSSQPMFKLDGSDFLLQNDAVTPTQGLLIDGTLPGAWTRYLNLNGSGSMVKHDKLSLNFDGTAKFSGTVEIDVGIASLRFSDAAVAHGMTAIVPTTVYGDFTALTPSLGGLTIKGFTDAGSYSALFLEGYNQDAVAPPILLNSKVKSGTGATALVTTTNTDHLVWFSNNDITNPTYDFRASGRVEIRNPAVSHGMTTGAADSAFLSLGHVVSLANGISIGGAALSGWSESSVGLELVGNVTTGLTSKGSGSLGAVVIVGRKKSGTDVGALGANENILAVLNGNLTTRFILDADGDSHQDVGTAWTNFDDHDDVALLTELSVNVARKDDPLRLELNEWMRTRRSALERLELVTFSEDGHHFVNMSRLSMLLVGAVRQMHSRLETIEHRLLTS